MLDFTTKKLPESGRAARYSEVLSSYYSSIESEREVIAEIQERDTLDAFSMAFDLGRLSCSVHKCNSPLHRYSMRKSPMQLGHSLQYIVEGNLTIVSDDHCHEVGPGDLVFLRSRKLLEYHTSSCGSKTIGVQLPWALVQSLAYGRNIALDASSRASPESAPVSPPSSTRSSILARTFPQPTAPLSRSAWPRRSSSLEPWRPDPLPMRREWAC